MKKEIQEVLKLLAGPDSYVFVDGHPVDSRRAKYSVWAKWLKQGNLKCFGCGREPHYFRMLECKGDGSIHESGETKYTFKLVGVNNKGKETAFTLDHWIPKSFLRKLATLFKVEIKNNLVPMCSCCNCQKGSKVPKDYKWGVTEYKPEFSVLKVK